MGMGEGGRCVGGERALKGGRGGVSGVWRWRWCCFGGWGGCGGGEGWWFEMESGRAGGLAGW